MKRDALPESPMIGALLAVSVVAAGGCSGTDEESNRCSGPRVLPNRSPYVFGESYGPPQDEEPNPGTFDRTPVARSLLLESTCEKKLEIEKACLVGEKDDSGESDAEQFSTKGPEPKALTFGESAAYRLTYERSQPNSGDDIDNVAAVFQTNAKNYPTLVVPVCARVVKEGAERSGVIDCTSPVEPPPQGEKKEGLCN